jgi:hypothetical protein
MEVIPICPDCKFYSCEWYDEKQKQLINTGYLNCDKFKEGQPKDKFKA